MKALTPAIALAFSVIASPTIAQTFSSGSTGADGALDLAVSCPGGTLPNCVIQLPPSGILNYTTVNIPTDTFLSFRNNGNNTPVIILAQGNVDIVGRISVDASSQDPGPGGFRGGPGGLPGFGPGAGPQPSGSLSGRWTGPLSLIPIVGGSGGSGSGGAWGGGGGGAVLIASSGLIDVHGGIHATGVQGWNNVSGPGSGGAIRLVANSLNIPGQLWAVGNSGANGGGEKGVIRLEAPAGHLSFSGSADPAAVLSSINPLIFPDAPPALSIISVGGYSVPAYSGQRFDTVDLLLPMQLPDPISVVVAASGIPVGTQIGISFGTTNAGTVTPGTLTGSTQSSTATIQVSGLNRTQLAYLFVSATFAVPGPAAPANPAGPDQVARVHVTAAPGAAPKFSFLRANGSSIDASRLPAEFLKHFKH